MCAMTGEYILYDERTKKAKHSRTIRLLPDQLKCDAILIEEVKSTPYDDYAVHYQ